MNMYRHIDYRFIGIRTHAHTLEVGGVMPKVSPTGNSSSEFDVFALSRYAYASRDVRDVRDVPCVRRRARDRSIGRVRSEGPEIRLRLRRSGGFSSFFFSCSSRVSRLESTFHVLLQVLFIFPMEMNNSWSPPRGHRPVMLESPLFL